jgi:hypothetical protein
MDAASAASISRRKNLRGRRRRYAACEQIVIEIGCRPLVLALGRRLLLGLLISERRSFDRKDRTFPRMLGESPQLVSRPPIGEVLEPRR